MVSLPRACEHCGAKMMHYGPCTCPDVVLESIDDERKQIAARLKELEKLEKATIKKKLVALGAIGAR